MERMREREKGGGIRENGYLTQQKRQKKWEGGGMRWREEAHRMPSGKLGGKREDLVCVCELERGKWAGPDA